MAKNKISPTDLDDQVYTSNKSTIIKLSLLTIFVFLVGLLSNFPVKENIALVVSNVIKSNRACPIQYKEINVSFFLPSITIVNTNIDGACFSSPGKQLPLNDVKLLFYGPSFSPLGFKLKTEIEKGKTKLDIFLSIGFGGQSIRISESKVDSSILNSISGGKFQINGLFDIDAVFNIKKNKLRSGNIYIKSNNLAIPVQNIAGFELPHLPIENLLMKAVIKPLSKSISQLNIVNFEFGANNSPILGQIKGPIKINANSLRSSEISLSGKVKFSQSFIESFGILNLFLAGKSVDDEGFYKLSVGGNLQKPIPKFL